jgi:PPP family 3-phenylpropionic acid transporter
MEPFMDDIKKFEKRLNINYALIQGVDTLFYCSIFSFASVFLLSRNFSNTQVGITLTLASAFGLIISPLVASFADKTTKIPLRSLVAILLGFVALFSLFLLFTPSLIVPTAILFIMLMVVFSTQVSLITSLAMEHINNGVNVNYSLARGIGSFSYALLSILLGYLVKDLGTKVILLITIGLSFITIFLVLIFPKPAARSSSIKATEKQASSLIDFFRKNKRFMGVVGCVALIFFSHTFISTYMIQILQHAGGDSADMGVANAIAAFLELPAMALFPLFLKKIKNAGTALKFAGVFFVIKAAVTTLAPSIFWIDAAQVLQFFAYAVITPASVFYVNQRVSPEDKVKGQTIMGMSMGITGLVANFLGGVILDSSGGVPLMMGVGTAITLLGLVLLVFIDRWPNQVIEEKAL